MRAFLAGLLILSLGCRRESPEAQVKRAFAACVAAVEAGDPEPLILRMAPDFRGPEGMDRDAAKLFLIGLFQREKVGVTVLEARTEAEAEAGLQEVHLLLTSRGGAGLLPKDASRRVFTIRWAKVKGEWLLKEIRE